MNAGGRMRLAEILASRKDRVLTGWLGQQRSSRTPASEVDIHSQFATFLDIFVDTLGISDSLEADSEIRNPIRTHLADITARRTRQGFTLGETVTFIFSLKQQMYSQLRDASTDPADLTSMALVTGSRAHYSTRSAFLRCMHIRKAVNKSTRDSNKNCSNCRLRSFSSGKTFLCYRGSVRRIPRAHRL